MRREKTLVGKGVPLRFMFHILVEAIYSFTTQTESVSFSTIFVFSYINSPNAMISLLPALRKSSKIKFSTSVSVSFLSTNRDRALKPTSFCNSAILKGLNHPLANQSASCKCKKSYHTTTLLNKEKLSVAIVGTGPSGCYTAKYLVSSLRQAKKKSSVPKESDPNESVSNSIKDLERVHIDMIDKLPTPFGLVRSGVAPDHPEVKNVENDFSLLFQNNVNGSEEDKGKDKGNSDDVLKSSIEFRGNVNIGTDVSLQELQNLYDVVVLAYGCESDRKLGIEGEHLNGVHSAREFVAWYNGHPDFESASDTFREVLEDPGEASVVVIGQGNVALDCARVLAKGKEGLIDTDITSYALDVIQGGVKSTSVVGRRGHVQGAFTIKELRELTKLSDTSFIVDQDELDAGTTPATKEELEGARARPKVRIDKLLRDVASQPTDTSDGKNIKEVRIRFLLNPVEFKSDPNDPLKLGSVLCERTKLEGDAGKQVAVGTGEMEEISANMALVSIGYKGVQIPGLEDSMFDQRRGIVKNENGKVGGNLYVSGWLKRGPSGIIGTNIVDAKNTVSSIITDFEGVPDDKVEGRRGFDGLLKNRNVEFIDWVTYLKIDAAEKDSSRLRTKDQPREKFTNVTEMLAYR